MAFRAKPSYGTTFLAIAALALAAILAAGARGQDQRDLASLVAKVDPSVVTITLDNQAQGSGFVVDPKGLVATNYHVIEGAKWATVAFPDKRIATVDGFLAIDPTRDLALLHITIGVTGPAFDNRSGIGNGSLRGRRLMDYRLPSGDGRPMPGAGSFDGTTPIPNRGAFDDRNPNGTGSPVAPGKPAGGTPVGGGKDLATLHLADSLPAKGERVFAFGSPMGLSGSVSDGIVACIRPGTEVSETLLKLTHRDVYRKSLALWIQLNEFRNELNDNVMALEKKLQQIVPIDPRHSARGENSRNRRRSVVFEQLGKAYAEYAGNLKSLDNTEVDPDIVMLGVAEADVAQRMGDAYQKLSGATITQSNQDQFWADVSLGRLKDAATDLRTVRDLLRIKLGSRYDKPFPSMEETAKNPDANAEAGEARQTDEATAADSAASSDVSGSGEKERLAVLRVWTDRTGRHQVQAKYLGLESGKARLQKTDGTVISVPISTLSEADQRFIGVVP